MESTKLGSTTFNVVTRIFFTTGMNTEGMTKIYHSNFFVGATSSTPSIYWTENSYGTTTNVGTLTILDVYVITLLVGHTELRFSIQLAIVRLM